MIEKRKTMAEQSDTKKTESAPPAAPSASTNTTAGVKLAGTTRFVEAFNNYLRHLGEGWEAARQAFRESHRKFDTAGGNLRAEAEKLWSEPSRRYTEELREAWLGPVEDRQRAIADVYQRYQSGLHDAITSTTQQSQALQGEFLQVITTSHERYAENCKVAFKEFLGDLKRAWQSVDVDQLDAPTLAGIQRITSQAAQHAWCTGAL
jgi:hypothetical protein